MYNLTLPFSEGWRYGTFKAHCCRLCVVANYSHMYISYSPTTTSPSAVKGSPSPREERALHSSFTSVQKKSLLPSTHTETRTAAAHSLSPEGGNDKQEREEDYRTTHSENRSPSKGSRQSEMADDASTPANEYKLVGPTLPDVTPTDVKLKESEEASPAVKRQRFVGPTLPPEATTDHQTLRTRRSAKRKRSTEGDSSPTKVSST